MNVNGTEMFVIKLYAKILKFIFCRLDKQTQYTYVI